MKEQILKFATTADHTVYSNMNQIVIKEQLSSQFTHRQIDECLLIHEDCTKVLPQIPDKSIDISFTSPPYNRKRNDKYTHFDDRQSDWFHLNKSVIENLLRVTKRHVFYNIQANYYNRKQVYDLIGVFSDKIQDIHIWEKSNPMPASGKNITNALEYFIVLGEKPLKSNRTYTKNIITTSVNSQMPKHHKAVMKPEVARHFLSTFCQPGDLIIDPFSGMGTTGEICNQLGLHSILIEKSETYFTDSFQNKTKNK